jgi:streptogramin lyase
VQGVAYRVDPKTEAVDTIALPGGADGIAADDDGVWVMDRGSGFVVRIDPVSEIVGQQIRVGANPSCIAVGSGFVWVATPDEGAVYRIDPGSLVVTPIAVGGDPGPGWVSVGEGAVWTSVG